MTTSTTWLLIIGVPLLVLSIIVGAVLGASWSRAGRWRPGEAWQDEPVWFGQPGAEVPAGVEQVVGGDVERSAAPAPVQLPAGKHLGGARGQW